MNKNCIYNEYNFVICYFELIQSINQCIRFHTIGYLQTQLGYNTEQSLCKFYHEVPWRKIFLYILLSTYHLFWCRRLLFIKQPYFKFVFFTIQLTVLA